MMSKIAMIASTPTITMRTSTNTWNDSIYIYIAAGRIGIIVVGPIIVSRAAITAIDRIGITVIDLITTIVDRARMTLRDCA
jgi:hypothetical protein